MIAKPQGAAHHPVFRVLEDNMSNKTGVSRKNVLSRRFRELQGCFWRVVETETEDRSGHVRVTNIAAQAVKVFKQAIDTGCVSWPDDYLWVGGRSRLLDPDAVVLLGEIDWQSTVTDLWNQFPGEIPENPNQLRIRVQNINQPQEIRTGRAYEDTWVERAENYAFICGWLSDRILDGSLMSPPKLRESRLETASSGKVTRRTPDEVCELCWNYLAAHHKYEEGGMIECYEPVVLSEMAEELDLGKSTVCRFFKRNLTPWTKYASSLSKPDFRVALGAKIRRFRREQISYQGPQRERAVEDVHVHD